MSERDWKSENMMRQAAGSTLQPTPTPPSSLFSKWPLTHISESSEGSDHFFTSGQESSAIATGVARVNQRWGGSSN